MGMPGVITLGLAKLAACCCINFNASSPCITRTVSLYLSLTSALQITFTKYPTNILARISKNIGRYKSFNSHRFLIIVSISNKIPNNRNSIILNLE